MQTQTVEIVGFTRPDQPMRLRKALAETDLLNKVSLVLGVRVTTTSIIESGRLGDPQNSAPPIHELPAILRAIREAPAHTEVQGARYPAHLAARGPIGGSPNGEDPAI